MLFYEYSYREAMELNEKQLFLFRCKSNRDESKLQRFLQLLGLPAYSGWIDRDPCRVKKF